MFGINTYLRNAKEKAKEKAKLKMDKYVSEMDKSVEINGLIKEAILSHKDITKTENHDDVTYSIRNSIHIVKRITDVFEDIVCYGYELWIGDDFVNDHEINKTIYDQIKELYKNYRDDRINYVLDLMSGISETESKIFLKIPENDVFIDNVCLSFRHDYGLLDEKERKNLVFECREWIHSINKNLK